MLIYDLGTNQSVVCVTSILDSCNERGLILRYECYRYNLLENTFESSAKYEYPCNIAHEVLAVKTLVTDSCQTVLLKCRDGSENSATVKCCDWKIHEGLSFETLSTHCTSIHWEPHHITETLYCMLTDGNVILFVDVNKHSVVGQIRLKDDIVKLLCACYIQDSYVLLYCISWKEKSQRLAVLTIDKSYKKSHNQFHVNGFVPPLYGDVTRCAFVQIHQNCDKRDQSLHNCTYICTSRKQLVCFEDGRLIQCSPLSFEDARKVHLFVTPSFQKIIVIQNDKGELVCTDSATKRVLHSFAGVTQCLVDDFLCCGSEQLLIIFDKLLASFVLLDFEAVLVDKRSQDADQRKDYKDNSGAEQFTQVLNALSHRLQVGRTSLVQYETRLKEKDSLIEAACLNIQQMSLGEKTFDIKQPPCDDLVPLLPLNWQPPVKSEDCLPTVKEQSLPVLVLATWKKLVADHIVIGVKLKNTSDHPLLKPCLQVYSTSPHGHTPTACISKTFVQSLSVSSAGSKSEPTSHKRLKMDSDANIHTEFHSAEYIESGQVFFTTGTILASEIAQWNNLDVTVSLLWNSDKTRSEIKSGSGDGKIGTREQTVQSWSRNSEDKGHVLVIGHERISGQHLQTLGMSCCKETRSDLNEHEVYHELLSLNATQLCSELIVQATVSPVTDVHQILEKEQRFHPFQTFQCLICCDKRSLFYHARAQLDSEERCKGTLRIWTKDSSQLLLLLRAIYARSPDDLVMLPANHKSHNKDLTMAITAMHREISLATENLQKMIKESSVEVGQQEGDTVAMETNSDMTEAQRNFLADQSRVSSSKRKTATVKSSAWKEVNGVGVVSDEAIFRLTNTFQQ